MNDIKKYKNTELGLIPIDWELATLSDLGTFSKGSGISRSQAHSGDIPCVRYGELYTTHNFYIKQFESFISREIAESSERIFKGDILFAASGETKEEIGKAAAYLDEGEAYAGGDVIILTPKIEMDSLFYGFQLNAPNTARQKASMGQGDAVVHIHAKELAKILVPVPPVSEQKAIANVFRDIDSYLTTLESAIAKKRLLKQGAMQQLLTGKTRLPGFTDPWEQCKVGDKVKIVKGQNLQSRDFQYGSIPVIAGGKEIAGFHNACNHERPSITISASGAYAGYVWLHSHPIFASDCSVIEGNQVIDLHYLYHMLKFKQSYIYELQTGGAQPHIHAKDISPIILPFPSIKEQYTIGQVLTAMDDEITAFHREHTKYTLIKQGMIQKLLTGQIRLPQPCQSQE